MTTPTPDIQQVQLKGHKASVLCLAHSSEIHAPIQHQWTVAYLLSGSEDATARLWDLRTPLRASLCIQAQGEVASVAFSRKIPPRTEASGPFARDFCV